jgi:ppGpp synthetase/RelA/SpoT-type nucleotidyltranferase
MKISKAIRDIYADREPAYKLLFEKVEGVVQSFKNNSWHFEGRIKELESYALKLETGRCDADAAIGDFYACTIVVENLSSVKIAEDLVKEKFKIRERRPSSDNYTHKNPNSFPFDDLRLYAEWQDPHGVKPTGLNGLVFEVQIKTFLQHAWSIATHDLVYKSNEKNWSKERIAYQVKAMLEHAETSIVEASSLASSGSLDKVDSYTKKISKTIKLLNDLWPDQLLPSDVKRLAENVSELIRYVGVNLDDLKNYLKAETDLGRGINTLNLSPYGIVVQTLFNQSIDKMSEFMFSDEKRFKLLLHHDLEIPDGIDITKSRNVVYLS